MTAARRFLALLPVERLLLVYALLLLPVVRASLCVIGFGRTQNWLQALSRVSAPAALPLEQSSYVRMAASMVAVAARRGIVTASCLPRGLVLCMLLERKGLDASLKLGVRRHEGRLEAHAWVETRPFPGGAAHIAGFVPLETPLS